MEVLISSAHSRPLTPCMRRCARAFSPMTCGLTRIARTTAPGSWGGRPWPSGAQQPERSRRRLRNSIWSSDVSPPAVRSCEVVLFGAQTMIAAGPALRLVLSGLAPRPLVEEGSVGYRAASHRGADEDAVLGMWVAGRDGATRAHRPGLSPVPLPTLRQAVQRTQRRRTEPDPVSVRRHRPRGTLAPALQTGPAGSARDV